MSKFLIAGNWKMNAGLEEAQNLCEELSGRLKGIEITNEVLICPPSISISTVVKGVENISVKVGAQNVHFEDNGAFTGEISTEMVKGSGCTHIIVGHSERREFFHEDDQTVGLKTKKIVDSGLTAIVCVGEKLDQRNNGDQESVVMNQLDAVLNSITRNHAPNIVVAYEPVWAIGTGETASPEQAQSMHLFIKSLLKERWGSARADEVKVLYGGSMKPGNAEELLSQLDVDGGLIGGASLDAESFSEIITIAEKLS